MTKNKLNLLFPFLCLTLCLLFPSVCAAGARKGLAVSLESALPAIYPALILSCLLVRQIKVSEGKSFLLPFFLGLFCGFPIGAATVAHLVRDGKLDVRDGERLLFFCNNASPAFLISYCGANILGDPKKGYLLFFLQSLFSILFLFFFFGKRLFVRRSRTDAKNAQHSAWWKNLPLALREATNSFLYIISCIIFFSFITELIRHLFSLKKAPLALLGIFAELCGGLEHLRNFPMEIALPLCAWGCGFGGLSVHLQTAGILEDSPLSSIAHLKGKIVFALLMLMGTLFLQKLL